MTRVSYFPIVSPLEDPESAFHKKKDKTVNESSSNFHVDKFKSFEKTPDKKGTGYEPGTESNLVDEVKSEVEEMVDITMMTVKE